VDQFKAENTRDRPCAGRPGLATLVDKKRERNDISERENQI